MGLSGGAIAGIVIGCVAFVVLKTACKLSVLESTGAASYEVKLDDVQTRSV